MAVFFWFAFPALAVCVVASLYPERVTRPFAGSGRRRFTMQSAKEAGETIRTLEMQLAEAQRPKACPNCHHVAGWPTGAELVDSDRSDRAPHIHAPAPVDNGCRDTPLAAAQTARDTSLDALAQPGEEELLARLKANAVTAVLPRIPDCAPEPNPLDIPAPHPMASATAVPANIPDLAHDKVHAALDEAS